MCRKISIRTWAQHRESLKDSERWSHQVTSWVWFKTLEPFGEESIPSMTFLPDPSRINHQMVYYRCPWCSMSTCWGLRQLAYVGATGSGMPGNATLRKSRRTHLIVQPTRRIDQNDQNPPLNPYESWLIHIDSNHAVHLPGASQTHQAFLFLPAFPDFKPCSQAAKRWVKRTAERQDLKCKLQLKHLCDFWPNSTCWCERGAINCAINGM